MSSLGLGNGGSSVDAHAMGFLMKEPWSEGSWAHGAMKFSFKDVGGERKELL